MSIFSEDWRDCLRSHYQHVVREDDRVTKSSLLVVMNQVGFSEAELKELEVTATMRVEDAPGDFAPDLDILKKAQAIAEEANTFQPHPAECQCPQCVNINLVPHDRDGQPLALDVDELIDRAKSQRDDNDTAQKSLF